MQQDQGLPITVAAQMRACLLQGYLNNPRHSPATVSKDQPENPAPRTHLG